jgi:aminobenzoyl-glutamate utilization protein B
MMRRRLLTTIAGLLSVAASSSATAAPLADAQRAEIIRAVDAGAPQIGDAALKIWGFAEVGYQETKSTAVLQGQLKDAGFDLTTGVAGEPTAFIARFRNGAGPVVAILAEFDALPGMAQEAVPGHKPIPGQAAGHGCGHNIFGAASVGAAIALKAWMIKHNVPGELRVYGTPAEEGGSGKVYMVRDGLFKDVDVALHWHPGDANSAAQGVTLSNMSAKFRFRGTSAHAAAAPWRGRSALDAVEIFDVSANFMREHVPDRTRIHYVITSGGGAPNVVPDFAEVFYYTRSVDPKVVIDTMERLKRAAQGAALATDTTMEYEQVGGVYSLLPNDTLGKVMDANLRRVGGEHWTAEETAFANQLAPALPPGGKAKIGSQTEISPYKVDLVGESAGASTDSSDVSWAVPTVGMTAATWVPGTPAHSWQAAAASGMGIGIKGGVVAAKSIALTGADLFSNPALIKQAKAEFEERRGPGFVYKAMVGDRKPALDYRKVGGATGQ